MKAVVVDIKGKYAAALDENGTVRKIADTGYAPGQEIELHALRDRPHLSLRRIGSLAAAAALVLSIGVGTAYATPYGTVNLEGSSELAYTINRFDYVLDVTAQNEEAEALLSEIGKGRLKHHRVEDAVAVTVNLLTQSGDQEEETQSIQIVTNTRSEAHSEQLQAQLERKLRGEERHGEPSDQAAALKIGSGPDPEPAADRNEHGGKNEDREEGIGKENTAREDRMMEQRPDPPSTEEIAADEKSGREEPDHAERELFPDAPGSRKQEGFPAQDADPSRPAGGQPEPPEAPAGPGTGKEAPPGFSPESMPSEGEPGGP